MKNKTQSDLHYAYKQCVGKINYYLTCIEIEKNTHWDIWSVYDYEIFLKQVYEYIIRRYKIYIPEIEWIIKKRI